MRSRAFFFVHYGSPLSRYHGVLNRRRFATLRVGLRNVRLVTVLQPQKSTKGFSLILCLLCFFVANHSGMESVLDNEKY